MQNFIEITEPSKDRLLLNINSIVAMAPSTDNEKTVFATFDGGYYEATESYEEVKSMIVESMRCC